MAAAAASIISDKKRNIMEAVYSDPQLGLSGDPQQLRYKLKDVDENISQREVQAFLAQKRSYQTLKPRRRPKKFEHIRVSGIDSIHASDLADVAGNRNFLAKENDNVKFLLLVIDVFSKYLWVVPLHRKTAVEVSTALQSIYTNSKRIPQRFWVDQGKEYYNEKVAALFKKYNIEIYSVLSAIKSGVAERVVRTFKTRLYRYLYEADTYRYIDVLQDLVIGYNNSLHRSIGRAPATVRPRHTQEILTRLNSSMIHQPVNSQRIIFPVGSIVRLSLAGLLFQKAYWGTFSGELYRVVQVFPERRPIRYKVQAVESQKIMPGVFYAAELLLGTDHR